MVRAKPTSTRTTAIDILSTTFAMPLVSRTQRYIWRKVNAVPNRFGRQNISSRGFAALGKINTTKMYCTVDVQMELALYQIAVNIRVNRETSLSIVLKRRRNSQGFNIRITVTEK